MLGIGVFERELACNARVLGCYASFLPFPYRRVSVGENMNLIKNRKAIIDRVQPRLSTWKANTLSIGVNSPL